MALDYLATLLAQHLDGDDHLGDARITRLAGRLVISLPGDLLFAPGSTALDADARAMLFRLGGLLRHLRNRIAVAGHADPARTADRRDLNWELSIGRAVVVANELRRAGYGREIVALGYADGRFDALPADLSAARREALARRVDVIVGAAERLF